MLSESQRALLIQYFKHIELSGEQRDRIAAKYWEASPPERIEIALAYHTLFTDGDFVSRLLTQHDIHRNGGLSPVPQPSEATAFPSVPAPDVENGEARSAGRDNQKSTASAPASPTGVSLTHGSTASAVAAAPRRTHTQMLLRTAIQDQFPKLTGDGPYTLVFSVVETEAQRKEMIDLYASQFEHPDPAELHKLVLLPPCSTRTRRRTNGSYTWFLRCVETGDAVCAVTVTSHNYDNHRFVEMPLFATAAGYKKCGLGKLLNAALRTWCHASDFEFIMISADLKAIPFWQHLGYKIMSRQEKNGIAFYYEHECYTFYDAEPMICYCDNRSRKRPRGISLSPLHEQREVDSVLAQMPRFVVSGEVELPTP